MGKVYFPMDHTPDQWREMARECHQRSAESFERCDTDGFLSQWASTVTGRLYERLATVAESGGRWTFTTLADAAGNVIEGAREVKTRYGWAWVTPDGQWFNPSQASDPDVARARNLAKGFQLVQVERDAVVTLSEGGAMGCYPVVLPKR
jgi:hypothetical protein